MGRVELPSQEMDKIVFPLQDIISCVAEPGDMRNGTLKQMETIKIALVCYMSELRGNQTSAMALQAR